MPYDFPILQDLDVSPQTAYDIINEGLQSMRCSYLSHQALGNDRKAIEICDKILQGERMLHFIRINTVPGKVPNKLP